MSKRRRSNGAPNPPQRAAHAETVDRIYRDADGALPDFTRLDRRRPTWHRWVIGGGLITLALLAVAAWAGFLIFKPYTVSSGGNVVVTADAPATAAIGEELTYRVRIANDDRVPIARTTVEVRLPADFTMTTADPAPDDARGLRWTIGTLPARGERQIEIRGRLYGTPSTEYRAEIIAIYRPANFNADFQAVAHATTTLAASPLTMAIAGPTDTVPGERGTYTLTYENTGDTSSPPTAVLLELPASFALAETTPKRPKPDELLWAIGELAPHAKGEVTIAGSFSGDAKGPLELHATIALVLADRRLPQSDARMTTRVLGGDVVVIATVNDQTTGVDARPGDTLQFRIALRNDGEAELRDIVVRATFDATAIADRSILDFNKLTDPANGAVVGEQVSTTTRRGTITWTATNIPDLASVKPGEQRMIAFALPLRSAEALGNLPTGARVTFVTATDIPATGTTEKPRTVRSASLEIRVVR